MTFCAVSAIFLITAVVAANLPVVVLGQMAYYNQHNNFYDAQQTEYCQNKGVYGSARDCGYGTKNQNWFGYYYLGKRYPYELGSNLPYGYGSGAQPFFSDPYAGGAPGTSYGPGGYIASALQPMNHNYHHHYNNHY